MAQYEWSQVSARPHGMQGCSGPPHERGCRPRDFRGSRRRGGWQSALNLPFPWSTPPWWIFKGESPLVSWRKWRTFRYQIHRARPRPDPHDTLTQNEWEKSDLWRPGRFSSRELQLVRRQRRLTRNLQTGLYLPSRGTKYAAARSRTAIGRIFAFQEIARRWLFPAQSIRSAEAISNKQGGCIGKWWWGRRRLSSLSRDRLREPGTLRPCLLQGEKPD